MQDATSLPHDLDACHALLADFSARLANHEALLLEQASALVALQAARETATAATPIISPPSTCGGDCKRWTASQKMYKAITTRETAFTRAARMPTR